MVWNVDTATQYGLKSGLLKQGETATGGLLAQRAAAAGKSGELDSAIKAANTSAQPAASTSPSENTLKWNQDVATQLGQFYGLLQPGQVATGGFLAEKLKNADPALAAEFNRVASGIQSGSMTPDMLGNQLIEYQTKVKPKSEDFGSLAKAPYEKFTPYAEPAPEFKPFTLSDFMESPDYQFRLGEGQKAIDRAASARGNMFSGKALKDAARFGSNLAAGEFENAYNRYNTNFGIKQGAFTDAYNRYNQNFNTGYGQARTDSDTLFNRLATMSNAGSGMAGTAVNLGQNYAGNAGSIYGQQGSTAAAAAINRGNQQAQLFSDLFNYARK